MAKKHPRRHISPFADRGAVATYWHAGWTGRRVGELLIPLARQQSAWARAMQHSVMISRAATTDPDLASGQIYDIDKLYVTSDRSFAEAWSILVPSAEVRTQLPKFGLQAGAFYGVELLDSQGNSLRVPPEPDPDYPLGGSFQVDLARVVSVHRPRMSRTQARIHFERMAGRPNTEPH